MDNVQETLNDLQSSVTGFLGAALVDHDSGMALGAVGSGLDLEVAAAGNTEVVRSKLRVMKQLKIEGGIDDILITLTGQMHLIRPIGETLFLYLAIDRERGNLGMARHIMTGAAKQLKV